MLLYRSLFSVVLFEADIFAGPVLLALDLCLFACSHYPICFSSSFHAIDMALLSAKAMRFSPSELPALYTLLNSFTLKMLALIATRCLCFNGEQRKSGYGKKEEFHCDSEF